MEMKEIRDAMLRLSCIACTHYHYDPAGQTFGDGAIHYLVEIRDFFFIAWENNETGTMIVNPITRFSLDELMELGIEEAWTVLRVPATSAEGIQFRTIDNVELDDAYRKTEKDIHHCGALQPAE